MLRDAPNFDRCRGHEVIQGFGIWGMLFHAYYANDCISSTNGLDSLGSISPSPPEVDGDLESAQLSADSLTNSLKEGV